MGRGRAGTRVQAPKRLKSANLSLKKTSRAQCCSSVHVGVMHSPGMRGGC